MGADVAWGGCGRRTFPEGRMWEARAEMGLGQYVRVGTASIWVEAGRKREWAACYGVNLAGG